MQLGELPEDIFAGLRVQSSVPQQQRRSAAGIVDEADCKSPCGIKLVDCSCNLLTRLPASLRCLVGLSVLRLSRNQLSESSIPWDALAGACAHSLCVLDLDHNRFSVRCFGVDFGCWQVSCADAVPAAARSGAWAEGHWAASLILSSLLLSGRNYQGRSSPALITCSTCRAQVAS